RDNPPKLLHPLVALLHGHRQCLMNAASHLFHREGIDEHSAHQLPGSAGEATQDKHTIFIKPAGYEFLGDQVHAVIRGADDAEIGQPVESHHLDWRMLLLEIYDRPPRVCAPAPIDLFDQAVDLIIEKLVLAHARAAGHADLDKDQPFLEFRVFAEK